MRLGKQVGLLRDAFPADTVTRLTGGFVNPDPLLWPINQGKYYADLGFLCMREDEKLFLDAYLLQRYAPQEPFGVLRHEEYFIDWDGSRAGGINTPLMEPDYVTKKQLWSVNGPKIISNFRSFARTAVCAQIYGMVSPKLNEVLSPSKATRLVVCLPGWFHYLEKRFFGPILEWHRTHPWEGAIRVGTSIEGDTHRIFSRHSTSTEVFECDITGLEFCYNQDYWDMLCRLRQRQSKYPQHIKALYDAARHAKLVFPDGTVCDETVAEKSGGQNTLCDNSIATEITFRRAHYNFCADRKLPYSAEDMKLDIMGDNALVSFYGPLTGKNVMFVFQVYFRLWGFHLKAKAAKGNGAWGLVWCGWTKDGPRQWIRFEKPDKMLAKACFQSKTIEVAVQQLQACYRLLYNTKVLAEIRHAIKRVESLYKVSIKLPNWGHIQLSLAEFIPQCARFPDFYSRSEPAEHPVHNGAQAPPDKDSAMPKGKKKPKTEVIRIKPKLIKAKAKKKKGPKKAKKPRGSSARSTLDGLTMARAGDSQQSVIQMLYADKCWEHQEMVLAQTGLRPTTFVGPPVPERRPGVKFFTKTVGHIALQNNVDNAVAWQRLVINPRMKSHIWSGATFNTTTGAVVSWNQANVEGYAGMLADFEAVACTGMLVKINDTTRADSIGGRAQYFCYQNIGPGALEVANLTNDATFSLDGRMWPVGAKEQFRCAFVSTDRDNDFAYVAPSADTNADAGVIVISFNCPAQSGTAPAQQFSIEIYAGWNGVPLAGESKDYLMPTTDAIDDGMVDVFLTRELMRVPQYSIKRCIQADGWLGDLWETGKGIFSAGTGLVKNLGKGDVGGAFESAWELGKNVKTVASIVGGGLSVEERLARKLIGFKPDERELAVKLLSCGFPTDGEIEAVIERRYYERVRRVRAPPKQCHFLDEDEKTTSIDLEYETVRSRPDVVARAHSASATQRR